MLNGLFALVRVHPCGRREPLLRGITRDMARVITEPPWDDGEEYAVVLEPDLVSTLRSGRLI